MKRYVKEFANACIEKEKNQHHWNLKKVKAINKTVVQCNNGLITEFEAVKIIVKIMEENHVDSN